MRGSIEKLGDAGVRETLFYGLAYASLKTTRGQSVQVRRAKAQAYLLEHSPLAVLPYELITGSMAGLCPVRRAAPSYGEQREKAKNILTAYLSGKKADQASADRNSVKTFEADFTTKKSRWALMSRVHHDSDITYGNLQKLIEDMRREFKNASIEKYEIGRELERGFKIDYGKDVRAEIDSLPWFAANHLALDYDGIARKGFDAVLREIETRRDRAAGAGQREYYDCARMVCEAGSRFIARYAAELRGQARRNGAPRKGELLQMAQICENITAKPAKTFREAVQFIWLLHIMASICWSSALSFGRLDQYLYKYYQSDIAAGTLTREEAKKLLCCVWLKINEPKMRTVQSVTLGGITPEGRDAANELTALCLEVTGELKLPYPNVGVRINADNPAWLYDKVVGSVKAGGGQPMVMNDAIWIANLKKLGYGGRHANDYYNMGCVEIMIPGKQPNWGVTDPIAFPMLFEEVFSRYHAGEVTLETFDDFRRAYLDALRDAVMADKAEADGKAAQMPGMCFDPLASLMTGGCLEKGSDMFQGGGELGTHWSFYAYGLGTAADSMAAIKKHVYEEKRFGVGEILRLLESDFDGEENARLFLDRRTPHYGNDLDDVDELANDILSNFDDMVLRLNSAGARDKYVTTLFGYFFHIYHGEITGATANGRRRGEPFSDSMGPSQGKDTGGPTKLLNSVLKLDHGGVTGGYALNLKVAPAMVKSKAGAKALRALIRSYLESGGPQLQIYFTDAETLEKARREPEKHRDIIVRVGGYCEYFVNLDASLQDEIIARTLHGA
jgi:formate C-acetyltransferase